ncbi:DUF4148 domain-containing protein [Burkholderia lata]|uniref:DUF4148 domain-containing protein n=1 Tax=Burkholderia lata (strain ATCC 17760 / DSM 23089 / LMG 22485 / NCIMB 9086 / R18194 / 383) TaxID=482957 RepID=UPI0009F67374
MNNLIRAVLLSCALSAPIAAFAQTADHALTRADVRADLVRVEQAGYRPISNDPNYPEDIQAAEAKVAAQPSQSVAARPAAAFAQASASGPTRADVVADLIQAERDGTLPTSNWDYPPSTQTIARNRELYAIAHGEPRTATASVRTGAAVSTASAQ